MRLSNSETGIECWVLLPLLGERIGVRGCSSNSLIRLRTPLPKEKDLIGTEPLDQVAVGNAIRENRFGDFPSRLLHQVNLFAVN